MVNLSTDCLLFQGKSFANSKKIMNKMGKSMNKAAKNLIETDRNLKKFSLTNKREIDRFTNTLYTNNQQREQFKPLATVILNMIEQDKMSEIDQSSIRDKAFNYIKTIFKSLTKN